MSQPLERINLKSATKALITETKTAGPIVMMQLMGGALIIASVITTGASAIDSDFRAQDQVHLEHKIYLEENSNNDHDDDMTLAEYEASQQAENAAHANAVIAKAYGRRS